MLWIIYITNQWLFINLGTCWFNYDRTYVLFTIYFIIQWIMNYPMDKLYSFIRYKYFEYMCIELYNGDKIKKVIRWLWSC